jgi:magnesium transporter
MPVGIEPFDTKLNYIRYNENEVIELPTDDLSQLQDVPDAIDWIHIQGLKDNDKILKIAYHLGMHPLIIEDIFNENQRAKTEDLENGVFVVLKFINYDNKNKKISIDQVSIIYQGNMILSFQNTDFPIFNIIRERIMKASGRIRKMKADYLLYSLIDLIVDHYFTVLEEIDDDIEILEENLIMNPQSDLLQEIYRLKREIIVIRRAVWPMREAVSTLDRSENPIVRDTTHIFIRDLYDHTIQVIDTTETLRDMISSMLDIYLSSVSNKMNEVMKVLTIFAAIFIPLTFLAGVYGMNFHFMPELSFKFAYPIWWIFTIVVGILMIIYFKRKKWL